MMIVKTENIKYFREHGWLPQKDILKYILMLCKRIKMIAQNQHQIIQKIGITTQRQDKYRNNPLVGFYLRKIDQLKSQTLTSHQIDNQLDKVEEQFWNKKKINQIERLSDTNCLGCRQFLLKKFPLMQGTDCNYFHPYIIINEQQFEERNIASVICGLSNQGGGQILIVKKYTQGRIIQGLNKKLKKNQILSIQNKFLKAIDCLYPKNIVQNYLAVVIKSVHLQYPYRNESLLQENKGQEFAIRASVIVDTSTRQRYFVEHKIKEKRSIFQIHRVIKSTTPNGNVYWDLQQIHNKYDKIVNLFSHPPYQPKILCKHEQSFHQGLNMHLNKKSQFLASESEKEVELNLSQEKLFITICQYSKNQNFNVYFPTISSNQRVVFFQINQIVDKTMFYGIVEDIFKQTKTKFKHLYPMPKLQEQLVRLRKKASPNTICYLYQYYIFEGKFHNFNSILKEKIKKSPLKQLFVYQQINQIFQTSQTMNQNQLKALSSILKQQFKKQPKYKKPPLAQTQDGKKYKNVELIFERQDLNIGVFAYLLLFLGKKRPKSDI